MSEYGSEDSDGLERFALVDDEDCLEVALQTLSKCSTLAVDAEGVFVAPSEKNDLESVSHHVSLDCCMLSLLICGLASSTRVL